ncbi:MAG TPA: ATP phosphoribosyltransferase regulatory subunit [Stellaceae bacterium]
MNDVLHPALLPVGLRDLLPPQAAWEAAVVERLMAVLAGFGYERIKAPLIEFEESLLSGAGAAMAKETFRLMDPISQRMIGVRADMTPQVARIAATRLARAPRPLRLSYAGQVLRVKGSQIRPERQLAQIGAELIGVETAAADVEAIALAAGALAGLGVGGLSVDLTLPPLVPAVLASYGIAGEKAEELRAALDHKDVAGVAALGGPAADLLSRLVEAAGPARQAMAALDRIDLRPAASVERDRLAAVVDGLAETSPDLRLTIDPVENRNFEYHTGICFTLFAKGVRGELGRGGRYVAEGSGRSEPATGFSLYVDTILHALPAPAPARRLYLPLGTPVQEGARLRGEGWVTVAGLAPVGDAVAEAARLGCTHAFIDGAAREVAASTARRQPAG